MAHGAVVLCVQMENFEAEQERKRKERDAAAQEDGWTVVKRHKVRTLL